MPASTTASARHPANTAAADILSAARDSMRHAGARLSSAQITPAGHVPVITGLRDLLLRLKTITSAWASTLAVLENADAVQHARTAAKLLNDSADATGRAHTCLAASLPSRQAEGPRSGLTGAVGNTLRSAEYFPRHAHVGLPVAAHSLFAEILADILGVVSVVLGRECALVEGAHMVAGLTVPTPVPDSLSQARELTRSAANAVTAAQVVLAEAGDAAA